MTRTRWIVLLVVILLLPFVWLGSQTLVSS
jgi:hypothetical protein